MGYGSLSRAWPAKYWEAFRLRVHDLIAWGYLDAKAGLGPYSQEQEITEAVVAAIQARLRSSVCPRWCKNYALKEDNPVAGPGRTGKRRKRPDLIFECTGRGRPEYIFEAKPLHKGRYTEGYYLGAEGLRRFLRGEYASDYPEAGMLGYVQTDTVLHWVTKLQAIIGRDSRGLGLTSPPQSASVNSLFPHEWISCHERKTGGEITIYHILLDCFMGIGASARIGVKQDGDVT